MFIRTLDALAAAGMVKTVAGGTHSGRYLTAADGMGFSYNDNRIAAGSDMTLWYKHHWEANFILSGGGTVTDLSSGQSWPLEAGVLFVVGPHDRHRLAMTDGHAPGQRLLPAAPGRRTPRRGRRLLAERANPADRPPHVREAGRRDARPRARR